MTFETFVLIMAGLGGAILGVARWFFTKKLPDFDEVYLHSILWALGFAIAWVGVQIFGLNYSWEQIAAAVPGIIGGASATNGAVAPKVAAAVDAYKASAAGKELPPGPP